MVRSFFEDIAMKAVSESHFEGQIKNILAVWMLRIQDLKNVSNSTETVMKNSKYKTLLFLNQATNLPATSKYLGCTKDNRHQHFKMR